jgi:hypothetical protein
MSDLVAPSSCFLFNSVIVHQDHFSKVDLQKIFSEKFGGVDFFYPSFNPSLDYYSKEMGPKDKLLRIILFNHQSFERDDLVKKKVWADTLEKKYALENKRIINIDVGMLTKDQMVLATGKPYSHRIYLNHGVYADLNYTFANESYHILPWTYPDYAHPEKINFFNWLRAGLF